MEGCTDNQKSVGSHYPAPLLRCIRWSECRSIQSCGLLVIYFCVDVIRLVSTENVQEGDNSKSSREPLLLQVMMDDCVKFNATINITQVLK